MKAASGSRGYISTSCLTSALDGGGWLRPLFGCFKIGKNPGINFTAEWVGPRARLVGCVKPRPHRDSIPGPSNT
jgi:hypothetical protein